MPITKYATQLVANLAKEPGYPADFAATYAANIASKEDNVKAVVAKIELGEGDAGIVYVTDAKASTKVTPSTCPTAANVPATYAGVVVKASPNAAAAQAFLTGSPDRTARRSSPRSGSCRRRDRASRRRSTAERPLRRASRARTPGVTVARRPRRPVALFLGLPVVALVVRARRSTGRWRMRSRRRSSSTRSC